MNSKSVLLAIVSLMFAVRMAGAQQSEPANAVQDTSKAQDKETAKKDHAPARLIEFHFAAAPWAQVLDWLKDITGLPIISTTRPTGSLTFVPPKEPDGKNKKYTVAEIIDVLNESLLQQKLVIVRREGSIVIWSADERLPSELVKSVTLEQLNDDLGKTEFVRLNYPLRFQQVDEFAPTVKKLMGSFGQVIPLEEANQLILIDNVANLRYVVKMINDIDDPEKHVAIYIHKCTFCRAALAAEKLKDMLGDPDRLPKTNKKSKHNIAYDERTNTVMVSGPHEKVNLAKIVISQLDRPTTNEKEESKAASKATPPSGLEEAMEQALKQNPDILFAEAKVREAEAELHRAQQQVLGKIVLAEADLKALRKILEESQTRRAILDRLRASGKGLVSDLDIGDAAVAVAKFNSDVAHKEAELSVLIGKLPIANRPLNSQREPPPILKTHLVENGNAAEMAKILQDVYKQSPTVRVAPVGNTQIMVYAPPAVQDDIAKHIETTNRNPSLIPEPPVPPLLQGKHVETLLKAMALTNPVDFKAGTPIQEVLNSLSQIIKREGGGINLVLAPDVATTLPAVKLQEPTTLAATLQLIEDMTPVRFVVRDYGIVGVNDGFIPPGSVMLNDVMRGKTNTGATPKKTPEKKSK
jgi:hypothetical protein